MNANPSIAVLAKKARALAASASRSLVSFLEWLEPKGIAIAGDVRRYAAAAWKSLGPLRERLKPARAALSKRTSLLATAAWQSLAPARKHLEPVARKMAPAWNRLERWTKRRPWRVALVAAVTLMILLAAFGGGTRFGRALLTSGRIAPLPADVRRAAHEKARQLAAELDARLDKKGRLARRAGDSARILIALDENGAGYANQVSPGIVEKFFRSVAGPECVCWRRLPHSQYPNDVGVTAWVLWALADFRIRASKGELEFLLSSQKSDGAWPEFAGAKQDWFASTYATAAAIIALEAQSKLDHDRSQAGRLARAVRRGAAWLQSSAAPGAAMWPDYPAWADAAKRRQFLGVSGFALFALHRAGAPGLDALDREWMRSFSAEVASAEARTSGKSVRIGKRMYADETRYYDLPWAILATVLAYPNGSLFDKIAAMRWLERQLGPGAAFYDIAGDSDTAAAAELLFALRNYPEIANP